TVVAGTEERPQKCGLSSFRGRGSRICRVAGSGILLHRCMRHERARFRFSRPFSCTGVSAMPRSSVTVLAAALLGALIASAPAAADTLLVDRARQSSSIQMPERGMSMAQVEARFGVPSERLDPRG